MKNKKIIFSDLSHDFVLENWLTTSEEVAKALWATVVWRGWDLAGDLKLLYESRYPWKKILSIDILSYLQKVGDYLNTLEWKIYEEDLRSLLSFIELHQAFLDGKWNSIYWRCIDSIKLKYPEYCNEITKILYNK